MWYNKLHHPLWIWIISLRNTVNLKTLPLHRATLPFQQELPIFGFRAQNLIAGHDTIYMPYNVYYSGWFNGFALKILRRRNRVEGPRRMTTMQRSLRVERESKAGKFDTS